MDRRRARRTPTPALPPIPCTSPMPKAPSGVARACRCGAVACDVQVRVRAVARARARCVEERRGASGRAARRRAPTIRTPTAVSAPRCTGSGRYALKRTIGSAEREERRRVAEAPGEAEPRGAPRARRSRAGGDQRRHSGEVVGVGRVAEAEQDRDARPRRARVAPSENVCDPVVESEHRQLTFGRARTVMASAGDEDDERADRGEQADRRGRRSSTRRKARLARTATRPIAGDREREPDAEGDDQERARSRRGAARSPRAGRRARTGTGAARRRCRLPSSERAARARRSWSWSW